MKTSIALLTAALLFPLEVEPQPVLRRRLTQKDKGIAKGGAAAPARETATSVAAIVSAPTNSPNETPRLPLFLGKAGKSGVFAETKKAALPKTLKLGPKASDTAALPVNRPLKGSSVQKGKSGKMAKAGGEKKNSKAAKSVATPFLPVAIDINDDLSMPMMSMPDDDFSWELFYEDFSVSMSLPNPFEDSFSFFYSFSMDANNV